jgi:hypothetical protein
LELKQETKKKVYEKPKSQNVVKMLEENGTPEGLFVEGCSIQMQCTAPDYST